MSSFQLVVALAGVFCLAPVSLYLLWLATVNKRDHPTVIGGGWDFAALLAGLSGFVLFGGGLLLSLLQSNVRYWKRGNFEAVRDAWGQEHVTWSLIVGGYFVVVVGGAVVTLLARRRTLVVYGVDPGLFEITLTDLFEQLGRPVERRGNLWVGGVPLFELDPFAASQTVTLRWLSDDARLFEEVERQVRQAVPTLPPGDGAAGRWLVSAATACLVFVVCCVGMMAYGMALVR